MPKDRLGRVDLIAALQCLAESGVKRLMVEGGATVINSFLQSRLVDYCVITVVPKLIGGVKAMDNLVRRTMCRRYPSSIAAISPWAATSSSTAA